MAYFTVGSMLKAKDKDNGEKGGFYLKFERPKDKNGNYVGDDMFPLTINEGDTLALVKPREELDFRVKKGWLDSSLAEAIKSKLPDFLKFHIKIKTKSDKAPQQTKSKSTKPQKRSNDEEF